MNTHTQTQNLLIEEDRAFYDWLDAVDLTTRRT